MPINEFPGYTFVPKSKSEDGKAHNYYRGEDAGFGGYVYAEPGIYGRAVCFDVSGMHPSSIRALNLFGEYTKRYADLVDARTAIKHKDFEKARGMLDGKLAPYLNDEGKAKDLSKALKLAQNSCYGMTAATYQNPFRDPRNENNIVALRGALFMINLKHEVQDRGYTVIHIKTDSIKVANPDKEIADFILDYGKKYGYSFEVEHAFKKICLVNDAVYIAKLDEDDPDSPGEWTATGAQFQIPYVFKSLFSKEPITFDDLCVTNSVSKSAMYLDMNEKLPEGEHDYRFIGRVGQFCPIKPGFGGGVLVRKNTNPLTGVTKYDSVSGCKGYRFLESEDIRGTEFEENIDTRYFEAMVDGAIETISKFGDFYDFSENESLRNVYSPTDAFSVR